MAWRRKAAATLALDAHDDYDAVGSTSVDVELARPAFLA
jgi:hypothetical protein